MTPEQKKRGPMIYEKEFTRVKELYQSLSPAAREIAGTMALLPVGCVVLYGGVMGALGMMGFGSVAALAVVTTAAALAGIAQSIDLETELRPWLAQQQAGNADARAVTSAIALKRHAQAFFGKAFGGAPAAFADMAAAMPDMTAASATQATQMPEAAVEAGLEAETEIRAVVIRLSGGGGVFNPVAVRMLSVANSDTAQKPAATSVAASVAARAAVQSSSQQGKV